jgi:uncharacterized membrane protein (DUF4010 family)
VVAISTNTLTKSVLAVASGPRPFSGRVVLGVLLVLGAVWAAALLT